jgi:Trk-type K+ transport system membrane component
MGLYLLIPTFIVIIVSVLIVRAGAIALRMTGLDEKTASFQALSAFTRAGFTTRESESVIGHPQRRTIISWLIILGNAGIVAVIVTGTSSLATTTDYRLAINIAVLGLGIYIIYRLTKLRPFTHKWQRFVENRFIRGKLFGFVRPLDHLTHLPGSYGIARTTITGDSPFAGGPLGGIPEDIKVLGIERVGKWLPNPGPDDDIADGDSLIVYGRLNVMERVFGRKREAGAG